MYNIPKKIKLADLPTKIEYLEKSSKLLAKEIYIKRDDKTGIELSGNKVRKLEYAVAEGINSGADTLITCGALQSNHCRAVAAVAAKLGMKAILVLVDGAKNPPNGNYLLDLMLGADIRLIEASEYKNVIAIMEDIKLECEKKQSQGLYYAYRCIQCYRNVRIHRGCSGNHEAGKRTWT